jgi:hypothetical protein
MTRSVPRAVSVLLIISFFVVFGVLGTGAHHDAHCPFMPAALALCSTPAAHVSHWQALFAAALQTILVFAAFVTVYAAYVLPEVRKDFYRLKRRFRARTTLMQDLFADGILNPKIPERALARVRI